MSESIYQSVICTHTHTHTQTHTHTHTNQHTHTHTQTNKKGDYHDNSLAVWSGGDFALLASSHLPWPVHELCWDPFTAYEFTTVGAGPSICFWLLMVEDDVGGAGGGANKGGCNVKLRVGFLLCVCV